MQPMYKIVLFDVDGVLLLPPKMFSAQYCEKYGIDPELQEQFYATKEFQDASIGKFDLKEALRKHNDKWQWQGTTDELLEMWFEGENCPNNPLLDIVGQLRASGSKVYLATQQEKYRKAYLENVIFKDKVDGIFCSCDIGYSKHENQFWEAVLNHIKKIDANIKPAGIAYFDDRQNLVGLAREQGIAAFVYKTPEQVKGEVFAAKAPTLHLEG